MFDQKNVRRQDRLLDEKRALELMTNGEYGFLALGASEAKGLPGGYTIPMSYAFDGKSVWFHCATEGEKLRRIDADCRASFCVVGLTQIQPSKFSTLYESVMVFGKIEVVQDSSQKLEALMLLVKKYSPEYAEAGAAYAEESLRRVTVLRLHIEKISAKAKAL